MARVMLVSPPWYVFLGGSSPAPVGLISLAGSLKAAGHEAAILNADVFGDPYLSDHDMLLAEERYKSRLADLSDPIWELVRERLRAWKPEVVGVHVKTPSWFAGRMVGRLAKEVLPDSLTVCGGPHVSCMPADVRNCREFDYGICGEGESPFVRLLETSSPTERGRIAGVISAQDEHADPGEGGDVAREFIDDIDTLSFAGWEALMDIERYDRLDLGAVMTSRGCPFRCRYCASHRTWKRKVRYRSPENVMAEVDYLTEKYGIRYIKFHDDTFTVNRPRIRAICAMLSQRKNLRWSCTTRADCIDLELAKLMAASGCSSVSIGVESGSDRILELMEKGETSDTIRKACQCLNKAKIPFVAYIMVGYPTETVEESQKTLSFAVSLGADSLCGSVVTPYPGTALFEWAQENGRIQATDYGDWRDYYHQSSTRGLWDVPREKAPVIIDAWFKTIQDYNERPGRLVRSFMRKLRSDPVGTMHRAYSVFRGRLSR